MESNYENHGSSINTLFNVLYHTLQGKKVPYNDVVQKVKQLFPIILPDMIASPDHNAIVKEVVDRYVSEVGIQTFDPEFIDLDREAKYWLYKEKDRISHPFFDRYKLYLSNDGFEPKVIKNIEEKAKNSGSAIIQKAFGDLAKTAAIVLKVATIAWDFEEGYNNASANWGVAEPTFGQKVGSGVVHTLLNLIPMVGIFIPESLLINIWAEFILPKINPEEAAKLEEQRAQAQAELDQYNADNGTDLSWSEYTKQVKGNYTWGEKISNGVKGFFSKEGVKKTATNVLLGPLAPLKTVFDKAGGFEGIKKSFSSFMAKDKQLAQLALKGDVKGLMTLSVDTGDEDVNEEDPSAATSSSAFKAIFGISKMLKLPTALMASVNNKIRDTVGNSIGRIKSDVTGMISTLGAMNEAAKEGKVGEVWNSTMTFMKRDEKSGIGGLFSTVSGIGGVFFTLTALINKVLNPVKEIVDKVKGGVDSVVSTVLGTEKGTDAATSIKTAQKKATKKAATAALLGPVGAAYNVYQTLSGGDSGMISQVDPKYSSMSLGGRSVGDMGCGPASAVNAMRALGARSSMSSAVNLARNYQTSGGTDLSYFKDEFGRHGIERGLDLARIDNE